jgi:hypothetical protein
MARKYSSISTETTLASDISNSATTMTVFSGGGATLIQGSGFADGDQFTVVIDPDTINEEIVFVTARSVDNFTITRGRSGTSAISHITGAKVKHVLTADDLNYFNTSSPASVVSAKGDVLVASADGVIDNLAVGTNDQYLVADSAATLGVKWGVSTSVVTLTGTQTLTNKTLTTPVATIGFTADTTTTYTVVLTDANKLVTLNNSSAVALKIPTDASVAFPTGTVINFQQIGTGQVTVSAVTSGTTTITSAGATSATPKTRTRYSAGSCIKTAANTWTVVGDIA